MFKTIDMHCDTLMKHLSLDLDGDLYNSKSSDVDFKRMIKGGVIAQFFAIFLLREENFKKYNIPKMDDDTYIDNAINYANKNIYKYNKYVDKILSYKDLLNNIDQNKSSIMLTIEDGRSIDSNIEKIDIYYDKGIRLIGLIWNDENCIAYPNSTDKNIMNMPLKEFGIDAIRRMNELGIIIDVSHLNDGGFYDVVKYSKYPFVASHSNSRFITDHPRNLTDDMIKLLANKGGVMGLNFMSLFLKDNSKYSKIDDMILHLEHIKNIGGEDILAMGSDLDGINCNLEINSVDKFNLLYERLLKNKWSYDLIDKLSHKNIMRVMEEVL